MILLNKLLFLMLIIFLWVGPVVAEIEDEEDFPDTMVFVERVRINPKTDFRYVVIKAKTDGGLMGWILLEPTIKCKWLYRFVQSYVYIDKEDGMVVLISPDNEKCYCSVIDVAEVLK